MTKQGTKQPVYLARVIIVPEVRVGKLVLHPSRFEARLGNRGLQLSKAEYATLLCLAQVAQNEDRVVATSEIQAFLAPSAANVRDLISRVRRKMQAIDPRVGISNVHGIGYVLQIK
jgi:DNA-binding response OmpR family regulator